MAPAAPAEPAWAAAGTIQAAINAAQPGDLIEIGAGSYTETLVIARAGRADAPITLRGAGAAATLISGRLRVVAGAAYWSIEDLAVQPSDNGDAIRLGDDPPLAAPPHDISLRRLHLSGGSGYGVRVASDVQRVLIEDSEIDHFDAGSADAHGIGIMTASGVTVRGCNIHHTSGDAIQVNTPDYPGYGRYASDILIEFNRLHEVRENALDIKSTRNLLARGNTMWGFQPSDGSTGMAIQVQYDAQQIVIMHNQIWAAAQGIEVSRGKKNGQLYPAAPAHVQISQNLLRDLGGPGLGQPPPGLAPVLFLPLASARAGAALGSRDVGNALIILSSSDVRVDNNTVLRAAGAALYLGESAGGGPPSALQVRNNVLGGLSADLAFPFALASMEWLTIGHNHYVGGGVNGQPLGSWLAAGFEQSATTGDPLLDSAYRPLPGSPLRDSGANVGLPFSGGAPDRGWREGG